MDFALAAFALAPGLALGSFLNVLAARVPLHRSIVTPALGLRRLRDADRVVRQRARHLVPAPAGPLPVVRRQDRLAVSGGRADGGAASSAACVLTFGLTCAARCGVVFCATLVTVSATDIERRIIPNRIVLPAAALVLGAQTARPAQPPSGRSAPFGAAGFLLAAALAYPGGMGMGDVKLALLLGAALGRSVPVALMVGMLSALVPSVALLVRHGRAGRKMTIPFGPFLALGGVVALFAGPQLLTAYLELSPVRAPFTSCPPCLPITTHDGDRRSSQRRASRRRPTRSRRPARACPDDRDAGSRRPRASRAQLAERYRLPLVDLAVAGVSPEATKLSRCACSSGSSRSRTRSTTTSCSRAHGSRATSTGIDELRLAARQPGRVRGRAARGRAARDPPPDARERGFRRDLVDDALDGRRRTRPKTTSRPTTASPTARSSASSTRSSSRPPRTAPATSTSSRRRTGSSSASGSTACSRRRSASRAGSRRRRHAPEGAREARHRRAAEAAGRSHVAQRRGGRPDARRPRRDAADRRGRVGDDAPARQVAQGADARGARAAPRRCGRSCGRSSAARPARCSSRARPAPASRRPCTRALARDQPAGDQRDHGRGSRSSTASRASARCRSTSAPG